MARRCQQSLYYGIFDKLIRMKLMILRYCLSGNLKVKAFFSLKKTIQKQGNVPVVF